MCTSPLYVKPRHLRFFPHVSMYQVPCGHCDECVTHKSNSLYVRAYHEYRACIAAGGIGFMCTLTYSNDTVPRYQGHMVFNKKHMIDFFKRLRMALDRYYKKHYNTSSPDFKYLCTSEYGSDPNATHRPHYHLLIFFRQYISHVTFRSVFRSCVQDNRVKVYKPFFGYVLQCDVIDRTRGGISYSAKYVCKDSFFASQDKLIRDKIRDVQYHIDRQFGIVHETDDMDVLHNQSVRSRKDYKNAVQQYVLPYRHMLQFYMCSNDFGVSAILDYYKDSFKSLTFININGYNFSVPRICYDYIERDNGKAFVIDLKQSCQAHYVLQKISYLRDNGYINLDFDEYTDIGLFVRNRLAFLKGKIVPKSPEMSIFQVYDNYFPSMKGNDNVGVLYDSLCTEQLQDLFAKVCQYIRLYDIVTCDARAYNVRRRLDDERQERQRKKQNRGLHI